MIDESAVQALKTNSSRPRTVFLIGAAWAMQVAQRVHELADLTRALFVTTPDAKGYINPRHPAYCGVFGFGGHSSAAALLDSAPDIVLAFGTGFGD